MLVIAHNGTLGHTASGDLQTAHSGEHCIAVGQTEQGLIVFT